MSKVMEEEFKRWTATLLAVAANNAISACVQNFVR